MTWRFRPRRLLRTGGLILLGLGIIFTVQSWDGDAPLFDSSRLTTGIYAVTSSAGERTRAGESPHQAPTIRLPSYCDKLNVGKIAIIIKTGATEGKDKLLSQLSTSLSCIPDPLIFSDLDQTLGLFQIHDVLSRVAKAVKVNNAEFDIYFAQKDLASKGLEDELIALGKRPAATTDWRTQGKSAAWALDKYKFLHMIERAWEYQPKKDWYVFIETDTYLSLPNLLKFLATQDHKQKQYLGNAIQMYEHSSTLFFAHGGSGFILSRATVEQFAVTEKGIAFRYDRRIQSAWFGDFVVADALDEALDVQVTDVSPTLQGENPTNFPFAESNWCKPVVTLHYMQPQDVRQVFEYENSQAFEGMKYRDLYALTYKTAFPSRRPDWDNGANEEKYAVRHPPLRADHADMGDFTQAQKHDPNSSFAACELACILRLECLQYSYRRYADKRSECHLSKAVRLGKAVAEGDLDSVESVSSGWLDEKISAFVATRPECPE